MRTEPRVHVAGITVHVHPGFAATQIFFCRASGASLNAAAMSFTFAN